MRNMLLRCFVLPLFFLVLSFSSVMACTSFVVPADDGSIVIGRTLEFASDTKSRLVYAPRGEKHTGTLPDGEAGLSWESKYASLYMDAFGLDCVNDGMNEAGLSVAALYFPGYAGFQTVKTEEKDQVLSSFDLSAWMLQNFSSVEEVRKALASVTVWGFEIAELGGVVPVHYVIYDSSGKAIVVEYVAGELHIYDNPVGVLTNSPEFPWHMTNLRNYVTLSPVGATDMSLRGLKLHRMGQGTGLTGIPGDPTPPSRFVKAALLSSWAKGAVDSDAAVVLAFHILNSLDIPYGVAGSASDGKTVYDSTLWGTVRDPLNLRFFYRTYRNQSIRMVDLKKLSKTSDRKVFSIQDDNVAPWTEVH